MTERIREATKRMKKQQEKAEERRNKEFKNGKWIVKEGRTFKEGDVVLVRSEPTTNKEKEEFKKMKRPLFGP